MVLPWLAAPETHRGRRSMNPMHMTSHSCRSSSSLSQMSRFFRHPLYSVLDAVVLRVFYLFLVLSSPSPWRTSSVIKYTAHSFLSSICSIPYIDAPFPHSFLSSACSIPNIDAPHSRICTRHRKFQDFPPVMWAEKCGVSSAHLASGSTRTNSTEILYKGQTVQVTFQPKDISKRHRPEPKIHIQNELRTASSCEKSDLHAINLSSRGITISESHEVKSPISAHDNTAVRVHQGNNPAQSFLSEAVGYLQKTRQLLRIRSEW